MCQKSESVVTYGGVCVSLLAFEGLGLTQLLINKTTAPARYINTETKRVELNRSVKPKVETINIANHSEKPIATNELTRGMNKDVMTNTINGDVNINQTKNQP